MLPYDAARGVTVARESSVSSTTLTPVAVPSPTFSAGKFPSGHRYAGLDQVALTVVQHHNNGAGVGVRAQDGAGNVWVRLGAGRHGHFDVDEGVESIQLALADVDGNPDRAVVDVMFEISRA